MEPPTKVAKLRGLRARLPFMSQSALAAVLNLAHEEELPVAGRHALRQARDSTTKIHTPYGCLHSTIDVPTDAGQDEHIEVQSPLAMLYHAVSTSATLSEVLKRIVAQQQPSPTQPLRLILSADEVLPGNQLAYTAGRKFWIIYWSLAELGAGVLGDEDACDALLKSSWHVLGVREGGEQFRHQ